MKNIVTLLLFSIALNNHFLVCMNKNKNSNYNKTYRFNDTILHAFFIGKNSMIIGTQEGKLNILNTKHNELKQISLYNNETKKTNIAIQKVIYNSSKKHVCALTNVYTTIHKKQIVPCSNCYFININKRPYTIHKKDFSHAEIYYTDPTLKFIITRNIVTPEYSIHNFENTYKKIAEHKYQETLLAIAHNTTKELCAFHTHEKDKHTIIKVVSTKSWDALWCIRQAEANNMTFSTDGEWLIYTTQSSIHLINNNYTKIIEVAILFQSLIKSISYDEFGILQVIDKNNNLYRWEKLKNIWFKIQENNISKKNNKITHNHDKSLSASIFRHKIVVHKQPYAK